MTNDKNDVAEIYVAEDAGRKTAGSADLAGLARCDAVMTLVPKLAEHPDIAWAFDEARKLARSAPPPATSTTNWLHGPQFAWSLAGLAATACLVLAVFVTGTPPATTQFPLASGIQANFGPVGGLPAGFENQLADIEPVVLVDNVPVDGRSIAILPSAGIAPGSRVAFAGAETQGDDIATVFYERMLQRSAAVGLNATASAVATAYADTEYTAEQIASFLGVRAIVTASFDSDGEMVSVDLQITDAAGDGNAIEQRLIAPIDQIAALEDDITTSVLEALGASRQITQ